VALTGDTAAGHQVFRKCQACHSLEAGKNGLGPSLAGIVGEKAAAVPGYNFSPAMKASNLTWDAATLDAYLTDPQKVIPGNKMPFPGLKTGLFGCTFAFFLHLCGGIRHLVWDTVHGFELRSIYISGWSVVVASVALTVAAWVAGHCVGGWL
jgi:succinate dehydrogenase cytochrome b556 subunit